MRKIKFRAWDGKKMMFDGFAIIPTSPTWHASYLRGLDDVKLQRLINEHERKVHNDDIGGDYSVIDWSDFSSPELMQLTEFKDSKGTEIWEGDIVAVENEGDVITVCKWDTGGFTLEDEAGGHWTRQLYHQHNRLEVIGNIYEHPLK